MKDIFHSAALRLTGWYLAIIMVLSIGASAALYHVSSDELKNNAARQVGYFGGLLGQRDLGVFSQLRENYLNEDRDRLKASLLVFNIFVLAGGGAISYALARRTLRPIEETLESQKRFTADASHELRTPLTAMQTENEVALRNPKLGRAEAVALLKSNLEEVGKLKALSEGLLALANSSSSDEFYQALSTKEITMAALERVKKSAQAKKIKLTEGGADLTVNGSLQNLTDLLVILLDNAIKYSPAGSEVKLETKKRDKYALISVEDFGTGIDQTDIPHIFERFYRSDASRSKSQTPGYGLGLAIAKKIADTHESFIEVKSIKSRGSTFTVHMPLAS